MKWYISEVARILGVERDLVKTLAFRFKEYLSKDANPRKETPRRFTAEDVQVLAYVSMYWEDDPDIEEITAGLNCGDYRQEPYNSILSQMASIFQEPPDDLDETWRHGSLVGGISDGAFDTFALADSYKLAGDTLVDAVPSIAEAYELVYPIVYSYRHATELYLKAILSPTQRDHNLRSLCDRFKRHVKDKYHAETPAWFENVILAFDDFDADSTTFRYGDSGIVSRSTGDAGEFWIDLPHLKNLMGGLAKSFQRVRYANPCE